MVLHTRIAIACLLVLLTSLYLNAQTITWQRTYGDNNIDYGYSIVQTPDGGYIAVGRSKGIFVMRLNTFGDTLWTKVFEGGYAEHVVRTLDNNYVLIGTFANIVKFNIDGFMIWNQYYGDNGFRPTGIVQTKDSCLVICGLKEGVVTRKPCLIKLDSKGKLVYRK